MKESQIRKLALEKIERDGGVAWYPKKVKWHETDAWGVFDILVIYRRSEFVPIQITSVNNMAARKKKILDFYSKSNVSLYAEVWGWNANKKEFKIQRIYGGK